MIKAIFKIMITVFMFLAFLFACVVAFVFSDNTKVKDITTEGIGMFMEFWHISKTDLGNIRETK